MLNIDKELLKEALMGNFLGLIQEYDSTFNHAEGSKDMIYKLSDDRKHIVFTSVIEEVYGADCYDNLQETRTMPIQALDSSVFGECINELVIKENELKKYGLDRDKIFMSGEYNDFIENYSFNFSQDTEAINQDYYYNCDTQRTMYIPIDEICDYLLNFKFTKPLEELPKNLKYIDEKLCKHLMIEIFKNKLENDLSDNTPSISRHKI